MPTAIQTEPALRGLTIQAMSRQSGLSEHTLRYYERIGLIAPTERDLTSNHRRYAPETVAVVDALACLRGAGMPISEVRRLLHLYSGPLDADALCQLKAIYRAHAATLRTEIAAMQERLAYVTGKADYFDALESGDEQRVRQITASNEKLAAAVATQVRIQQRKNSK